MILNASQSSANTCASKYYAVFQLVVLGLSHDVILYPLGSGLSLSVHFMEAARHLQNDSDLCSRLALFGFEC